MKKMSRRKSKGTELPINAVVVIIILLVVAVIVIMWVSKNIQGGQDSAALYRKRLELCRDYSEAGCKLSGISESNRESFRNQLTDACTAMGLKMTDCPSFDEDCGQVCCSDLCSGISE